MVRFSGDIGFPPVEHIDWRKIPMVVFVLNVKVLVKQPEAEHIFVIYFL